MRSLHTDLREDGYPRLQWGARTCWFLTPSHGRTVFLGDNGFCKYDDAGLRVAKGLVRVIPRGHCAAIVLNGVAYKQKPPRFDLGRIMAESPMRLPCRKRQSRQRNSPAIIARRGLNGLRAYQDDGYAQALILIA